MEINKNNYEAYLLDLWEGNLSEEGKAMLCHFFEEHPELDDGDALNILADVSITEENASFDKTAITFDQINTKNCEFFFIAYTEGDLSKEEMLSVGVFLKENPDLNEKFVQFNKAKLPEETIQYPHKEKLVFGKTPVISIQAKRWFVGAVAASVALMIWITSPFQSVSYKYTMTPTENIEISKDTSDSLKVEPTTPVIEPIAIGLENQFADQLNLSNAKGEKVSKQSKIKSEKLNKPAPTKTENLNPVSHHKQEYTAMEEIEANDLQNVVAAILSINKNEEKTVVRKEVNQKEEIPTLLDLTAAYLQRKNVLNDERKPDFKEILNNTLAYVNEDKQPVLEYHEKSNVKTTVFQLGNLKIEHKTRK